MTWATVSSPAARTGPWQRQRHGQWTVAGVIGVEEGQLQERARRGPVASPCLLARTESQSGGSDGSAEMARQNVCHDVQSDR